MNRAAALRELGQITQARDELSRLMPELDQMPASDSAMKGRAHYQLALCQWRLGDRAAAQRSAEASLAAYDGAPKANPVDPALRRQSEEFLAAVKAGKAPPPLAKIDAPAALEAARARYRAREALAKLPLNQKAAPLLDQVLGPARSTQEVFDALDRYYREQGKPAVWFLPLDEPIAPWTGVRRRPLVLVRLLSQTAFLTSASRDATPRRIRRDFCWPRPGSVTHNQREARKRSGRVFLRQATGSRGEA